MGNCSRQGMVMKQPLVFVILVNWNGLAHLQQCLPTLQRTTYSRWQALVVDNGSQDGSQAWVESHFPLVGWLGLTKNWGFAAANNAGIRQALHQAADYLVLLNNDTRLEPDWLEALVETAERFPQTAICQARQRSWDGQQEIQFRFVPAWAEAESFFLPIQPPNPPTLTPFASGCAMLLRGAFLPQIGLFDERYFMYVEDVDLTLRAWIAGYEVRDVPASIVYHRFGGSGSSSIQRMIWGYSNQLTTILKLYQPKTVASFRREIGRRWFATRNRWAWRGTLRCLGQIAGTLRQRQKIQHHRHTPDQRFLELCA